MNSRGRVERENMKSKGSSAELPIQVDILDLTRMDGTWNLFNEASATLLDTA